MKENFDFMESAARAGYPYTMKTAAELEGKLDAVIYTSYKTAKAAYEDAARHLREIAELYDDEKAYVFFSATITKTEFLYDRIPYYTHVSVLSRFRTLDRDRIYCAGGLQHKVAIVRDKRREA